MLRSLLVYFAWGLLLAVVITSIAIVHREIRRSLIDAAEQAEKRRRGAP